MKKIHVSLFVMLLLIGCQAASEGEMGSPPFVEEAAPESAGFNPDSLAMIGDYIEALVDSQWVAGGVALIASQGKIVYHEAVGFSDEERSNPLEEDDIFRMASMTKPITTVAVMQLVEQGKIGLQDPVTQYVPEFADPEVMLELNEEDSTYSARAADREITIHHLLTHTSGIAYGIFHPMAGPVYAKTGVAEGWTKAPLTLAQNIPVMGDLPLVHDPGEGWTYGINTDILGRIVEIASGQPLDVYFEEHIFEPLGMDDTYFYLPDTHADRLVDVSHTDAFDPTLLPDVAREDYPINGAKTYFPGGAGLSSTALDYFVFCDAIRQGGARNGTRILKAETVVQMTSNRIDSLWAYEGGKFGYGFAIQEAHGPNGILPGRYGWGGFYQTTFWIDPARDVIGILLTNAWPEGYWDGIQFEFEGLVNRAATDISTNAPS